MQYALQRVLVHRVVAARSIGRTRVVAQVQEIVLRYSLHDLTKHCESAITTVKNAYRLRGFQSGMLSGKIRDWHNNSPIFTF